MIQGNKCHEKNFFVEFVASMHKVLFSQWAYSKERGPRLRLHFGNGPTGFTHHKG
jgi:hypothetical protein